MIRHIPSDLICLNHIGRFDDAGKFCYVLIDGHHVKARRADIAITQDEARTFPLVRVNHNHGYTLLLNARWEPYPLGTADYNPYGCNGKLTGIVDEGTVTSRLFHASSTQHLKPGAEECIEYCSLSKMRAHNPRVSGDVPTFDLYTCG